MLIHPPITRPSGTLFPEEGLSPFPFFVEERLARFAFFFEEGGR